MAAPVLVVFGRGVSADGGRWALTAASAARVATAVTYVADHVAEYAAEYARSGLRPRVVFTGGWADACAGAPAPPPGSREGDLMLRLARAAGLDRYARLAAETRSRSTLENLLHTVADGLLAGPVYTPAAPLGLVTHTWHLPRVRHLAGRLLGLPAAALLDVPVTGDDPPGRAESVARLAARLCCLGTRDPARLVGRERLLVAALRRAERLAARPGPARTPGGPPAGPGAARAPGG